MIERDIQFEVDNTDKDFWNLYFSRFMGNIKDFSISLFNWKKYSIVKPDKVDADIAYLHYKENISQFIHPLNDKSNTLSNVRLSYFTDEVIDKLRLQNKYDKMFESSLALRNTYKFVDTEDINRSILLWEDGNFQKLSWDREFKEESIRQPYYLYNNNFVVLSFEEVYNNWVKPLINFVLDDKTNDLMNKKLRECTYHTMNNGKSIAILDKDEDSYFVYDFNLWYTDYKYDRETAYVEEDIRNNVVCRIFVTALKYVVSVVLAFVNDVEKLAQDYIFISQEDIDKYFKTGSNQKVEKAISKNIHKKYQQILNDICKTNSEYIEGSLMYYLYNILLESSDKYLKKEEADIKEKIKKIPIESIYEFFENCLSKVDLTKLDNIVILD